MFFSINSFFFSVLSFPFFVFDLNSYSKLKAIHFFFSFSLFAFINFFSFLHSIFFVAVVFVFLFRSCLLWKRPLTP